ncbi:DUF5348 domain-containing protein [Lederbergia sp. NSJ-179]
MLQDRWIIHLNERIYGLHCGKGVKLHINSMCIPRRIELDSLGIL